MAQKGIEVQTCQLSFPRQPGHKSQSNLVSVQNAELLKPEPQLVIVVVVVAAFEFDTEAGKGPFGYSPRLLTSLTHQGGL